MLYYPAMNRDDTNTTNSLAPPHIELSLVTGTMDRHASLNRLIESIKKHTTVSWELIVADASELPLYINHPRIRRLVEKPRMGHTRGYNRAFTHCTGKWVLWLNDDAEVLPGYDTAAISFMRDNPTCGMGALSYSELRVDGVWGPYHTNKYRDLPFANFGILLNDYGKKLGWFDPRFTMYGADNSLAFKVFMDGRSVLPIPGKHILHYSPKDKQREDNQKYRREAQIGFAYYNQYLQRMYETYFQLTGIKAGRYLNPSYRMTREAQQGTQQ